MNQGEAHAITEQIDGIQAELRRFVASLVRNPSDVDDVVQEVNVTIWDKREQFEPGSNFRAWAFSIARFKALAAHRDAYRSRLELFGDQLREKLDGHVAEIAAQTDHRRLALRECLQQLEEDQLSLLEARYSNESSLVKYAKSKGISADAAHKAISRLRRQLRQCVEKRLSDAEV